MGVDVFALIDLADYIFEDDDKENNDEIELDFGRFMEVVLQLRGLNGELSFLRNGITNS